MSADAIRAGRTALGIELGSTRIKACLVDAADPLNVLATGSHAWENELRDGVWTYAIDNVWAGLQNAYASLVDDVRERFGVIPETFGAIGISAMMHGYIATDDSGDLLVPFRTWRNTSTTRAATELSDALETNIPLRWSIAHLYQAVLDDEDHIPRVHSITTLSGYVHRALTGHDVLGVGDASGMFPIDPTTGLFDEGLLDRAQRLVSPHAPGLSLATVLPEVLNAGADAGELTAEGARLLDNTGTLTAGVPFAPPEGDAGTGMVATSAIAPRTGNVSVGTSVFAMVVLEHALQHRHEEIDLVATPAGAPVAMVHCNNGASELAAWAGLFERFAAVMGTPADSDAVFAALLGEALAADPDAGDVLAYNHLSGEPIAALPHGRPLVVRTPESRFSLGAFMRAQVYGVFGTLALGMKVLADENVALDRMFAHGGVFRTPEVAARMLAGAIDAPVAVAETASEGGAWGMALLAVYLRDAATASLDEFLDTRVFARAEFESFEPDPADVRGFADYLTRYEAGLSIEQAAIAALP